MDLARWLSLPSRLSPLLCSLAVLALAVRPGRAQLYESFETAETSWRIAEADCRPRILAQQRVRQNAHSGQGCEHLRIASGAGAKLYLAHRVEPARVIAELTPSLWVKSDRIGLQLMVRVVLPRTGALRSGQPVTALIHGQSYDQIGQWQRLTVPDVQRQLGRQVPVMRSQFGSGIDAREAYVDLIVLNAYSGPGVVNLWIDDLDLSGRVPPAPQLATAESDGADPPTSRPSADSGPWRSLSDKDDDPVRLQDSVLLAGGRPMLPRVIEHNGESFEQLQSLGFNAVKLNVSPSPEQLSEAQRLGLWLVAPPPHADGRRITAQYDRVLAWSLGSGLAQRELGATEELAAEARLADQWSQRPLVCAADSRLWAYSRLANLLIIDCSPLGGSFELTDYSPWLSERARLARLGTPIWARIQTDPDSQRLQQLAALGAADGAPIGVEPGQIRLLAYSAVTAGARGLCFESRSRLDAADPATRLRAQTLRLLNLELSLLEPWAAAGSCIESIDSSDPRARVTALRTERAELLIVERHAPEQQYVVGPTNREPISFVIPSVSAAPEVLRLTPAGLRPLPYRRQTGGFGVALDNPGLVSSIVVTQDPLVVSHLARALAAMQPVAARLEHDMAALVLETTEEVLQSLAKHSRAQRETPALLDEAKANLRQCEQLLSTGESYGAHVFAGRAMQPLARLRRAHWEDAVRGFPPVTSPCCVGFDALPAHWRLAEQLGAARWGPNCMAAGDFENLNHMIASGWGQHRREQAGLQAVVELSPLDPQSGRSALRMQVWASDQAAAPEVVEAPPVWITSAPVSVRAGQIVRIHGFVKVPQTIVGSRDGVMVFDSLGGPSLAHRIRETGGWREVALYRAAPQDAQLTITFALSGIGEAWLDEVAVTLLEPPLAAAPQQENQGSNTASVADRRGPERPS